MRIRDTGGHVPSEKISMSVEEINGISTKIRGLGRDLATSLGSPPAGRTPAALAAVKDAVTTIEEKLRRASSNLDAMMTVLDKRVSYMLKFDKDYPSTYATAADARKAGKKLAEKLLSDHHLDKSDLEKLASMTGEVEVLAEFFRRAARNGTELRSIPMGHDYDGPNMLELLNLATTGGLLDTGKDREAIANVVDPQMAGYGLSKFLDGEYGNGPKLRPELVAMLFERALWNNSSDLLSEVMKFDTIKNLVAHDPSTQDFLFNPSYPSGFTFYDEKLIAGLMREWNDPPTIDKLKAMLAGVNGPLDPKDPDGWTGGSDSFRRTSGEVARVLAELLTPYLGGQGKDSLAEQLRIDSDNSARGKDRALQVTAEDLVRLMRNIQSVDDGKAAGQLDLVAAVALANHDLTTAQGRAAYAAINGAYLGALSKRTSAEARAAGEAHADLYSDIAKRKGQVFKIAGLLQKAGAIGKINPYVLAGSKAMDVVLGHYEAQARRLAELSELIANRDAQTAANDEFVRQLETMQRTEHLTPAEFDELLLLWRHSNGPGGSATDIGQSRMD